MKHALAPLSLLALLSLAACGSDSSDPSDASTDCAKVATLSYDNYGKKFVDDYCASCHGADVKGDDRCVGPEEDPCSARAPANYTFSTLEEITLHKTEMADAVGSKTMPYNAPASISDDKRAEFVLWLDCGPK